LPPVIPRLDAAGGSVRSNTQEKSREIDVPCLGNAGIRGRNGSFGIDNGAVTGKRQDAAKQAGGKKHSANRRSFPFHLLWRQKWAVQRVSPDV
jgi:hypothetical protein